MAQRCTGRAELDAARAPHEERRAQFVFQGLDLPAHGGLGEVQLVGGRAERQASRDRLEGAQVVEAEWPLLALIHA